MSLTTQYLTLEQEYGLDALRAAMSEVAELDDDDDVTPINRLGRVQASLQDGRCENALRVSLAEVTIALATGPGEHRDLLERLRARLEAALQ